MKPEPVLEYRLLPPAKPPGEVWRAPLCYFFKWVLIGVYGRRNHMKGRLSCPDQPKTSHPYWMETYPLANPWGWIGLTLT